MTDDNQGTQAEETVARSQGSSDDAQLKVRSAKSASRAPLLWGVLSLGLAVGLGVGWWGHGLQAKKAAGAAVKGQGDNAAGSCKAWADTICGRMGNLAYECTHARAAGALLSDAACTQAQQTVLTKLDAIKVERAPCSELTSKLCADLGADGKGCELAKAKESTFSIGDCQDMNKRYPRVLAQIIERQEKGTLPAPPRGPRDLAIAKPN